MKFSRKMRFLIVCLALMLAATGAWAESASRQWTLGNVRIRIAEEDEFLLQPQMVFQTQRRDDALTAHFEVDSGEDVLVPVTMEFAGDTAYLSLGSGGRIYSMDLKTLGELLELGDDTDALLAEVKNIITLVLQARDLTDSAVLKEYDAQVNRLYEILTGVSAQTQEIEVEGKTMNARVYSGEMKVVHLLDLAEYMRNCGIPEYEELAASLLRVFNIAANRNYLSFSSHFYDGMFGDFDLNESFGTLEMVLAHDDELTYTRETVSEGEDIIHTSETIQREDSTIINTSSLEKHDENDASYQEKMRIEMRRTESGGEEIVLDLNSASSYTMQQPAAKRSIIRQENDTAHLEAVRRDGLLNGSMDVEIFSCDGYDSGEGPVEITETVLFTGTYAEERNADESITGVMEGRLSANENELVDFGLEISSGSGAEIPLLNDGETQVRALSADPGDLTYTLMQADLLSFAAEGAVLTTSEGLYDLIRFFNDDSDNEIWPEELGDDVHSLYNNYYNEPWRTFYSYADARELYAGGMPVFTEPEGSVLQYIMAGEHNMLACYLSNDGDFQIDITVMGTPSDATAPTEQVSCGDYTFIEEEGKVTCAYYYNKEVLVLVTFEDADRAEAEQIISGLKLVSSRGKLAA